MVWRKIVFQLEDFAHHNAQLISKNYMTYSFFTPTQVDYALTYGEDLISHPVYLEEKTTSTPAVAIGELQIIQRLYTVRDCPLNLGRYPTYGKVQFIPPGTRFVAYSQNKPSAEVIMIGKKRRVAKVLSVEKVDAAEDRFKLTSPDLISHNDFRKLNPSEYQILAMSSRWVYGRFKAEKCLRIGEDWFVSPLLGKEISEVKT